MKTLPELTRQDRELIDDIAQSDYFEPIFETRWRHLVDSMIWGLGFMIVLDYIHDYTSVTFLPFIQVPDSDRLLTFFILLIVLRKFGKDAIARRQLVLKLARIADVSTVNQSEPANANRISLEI